MAIGQESHLKTDHLLKMESKEDKLNRVCKTISFFLPLLDKRVNKLNINGKSGWNFKNNTF